jgi:hypothetical protein
MRLWAREMCGYPAIPVNMAATICDGFRILGLRSGTRTRVRHCVTCCILIFFLSRLLPATTADKATGNSSGYPTLGKVKVTDPSVRPGYKSRVALPKNTSVKPGKLGAELRQIEHSRARGSNTKPASFTGLQAGSSSRSSSMHFRSQSRNARGVSNRMGSGSGSKRSGAGRRVTERRR